MVAIEVRSPTQLTEQEERGRYCFSRCGGCAGRLRNGAGCYRISGVAEVCMVMKAVYELVRDGEVGAVDGWRVRELGLSGKGGRRGAFDRRWFGWVDSESYWRRPSKGENNFGAR
jgi:hypothetical protein